MPPHITYISLNKNDSPQPYIPTLGLPATGLDIYKIIDIHEVTDRPKLWNFTDVESAAALGRIIDGPIQSGADLEYAENALQSILLNDFTHVFIPTLRYSNGGLDSYLRVDKGLRNEASFKAFQKAGAFDFLAAMEHVDIRNGEIISDDSKLLGKNIEHIAKNFSESFEATSDFAYALPTSLNASTSFSNSILKCKISESHSRFIQSLYKRIELPWTENFIPNIGFNIRLPPLLALVLARSNKRENLLDIIGEIRDELEESRDELGRITDLLSSTTLNSSDIKNLCTRYEKSFDGIVPESLLSDAERRIRVIKQVYSVYSNLKPLIPMALSSVTCDPNLLAKCLLATTNQVRRNRKIVAASKTATKMASLMRMPNMQELIDTHFTFSERVLIDRYVNNSERRA